MSAIEGWELTPQQVQTKLIEADDTLLVLDVREPHERETVAITPSVHIPMGDVPRSLPQLESHAEDLIIVYCHHGVRSMQVTAFLRQQGFEQVMNMAGGIDRWARELDPAMKRY